jgi:SAM-dependent methyltransferase
MSDTPREEPAGGPPKLLANLGSGPRGQRRLPGLFAGWRELRVDADARVAPDLVADIVDLSAIETGSVDAAFASHCLEHLYLHEAGQAIREVHRILRDDGFFCMIVPDLQAIAQYIAEDRLHEIIYRSPAGPVTAHDMLYGFGAFLASGNPMMGHKCGFAPTLLLHTLRTAPFAEIVLRRRPTHEIAAVACKRPTGGEAQREALLAALEL